MTTPAAVTDDATPTPLTIPVTDLVADPTNRRTHTARNVDMIAAALRDVGAARSIVIDEHMEVLAGNGVVAAAAHAGISKVQIVDVEGDTIVAVRRSGLTPVQKRALALYDNRTAELAEWSLEQLTADLHDGADLLTFFNEEELQRMKILPPPPTPPADVADQPIDGAFLIVVTCATEAEQVRVLTQLIAEGLSCKALVS